MKTILQVVGIASIVLGLIFSLTQIPSIYDERKDMMYWKDAALENYDNELIEERYLVKQDIYISHLTITLASLVSVIFLGVFFFALAKIIELLEMIRINTTTKETKDTKDDTLVVLND